MKKDINPPVVTDIALAVVKEKNKQGETEWNVYMLNLKDETIEGVLVSSTGYGLLQGETRKTSTLRHFLDTIPPKSYEKIEPIMEDVFGLNNEYWVSFYLNKVMHDKKYIFLAETINERYFTTIPLINKLGVMIK